MPTQAEVQQLLVRLGFDDTAFKKGIASAEGRMLSLQRSTALLKQRLDEVAASKAFQRGQVAAGMQGLEQSLKRVRAQYGSVQDRATLSAAAEARYAKQTSAALDRRAAIAERVAAREATWAQRTADWNQARLATQAAAAEKAWKTEVAGINAATAAQARYAEQVRASSIGARFDRGLAAPTSRLGQIGVSAVTGSLKFLERSFLVTAAAGVVLESQFFKVQDAQAALARTLDNESAPAIAKVNRELLLLSREIPLPTTELYRIGEIAGTLGIRANDIAAFTEVVAKLAATTDLTADEAAKDFGKLLNIFGLTVGQADNLGSALVKLSVSQASSDQAILTSTERFASLAKNMGLLPPQILAIASAATALGQEPEAVGGSLQRVFGIFNKLLGEETGKKGPSQKLQDFARVSGLTVKELRAQWATNPMEGFFKFLEGFGALSPQEQAQLFGPGELFPTFVRGAQTLQNLASQLPLLKQGVTDASAAFRDGNVLTEQAAVRFDTLRNNLILLKNAFVEAGYVFGAGFQDEAGDAVKQLTKYIIDSLPAIERFGQQVGRIIEGIDWNRAKAYADAFFGTIKKGFDIVASLPPDLLALLGAFKAFNFLSGGALGGITRSFASGIGNVVGAALKSALVAAGLGKLFVQPVFVTNPGLGGVGGGGVTIAGASLAAIATGIGGVLLTQLPKFTAEGVSRQSSPAQQSSFARSLNDPITQWIQSLIEGPRPTPSNGFLFGSDLAAQNTKLKNMYEAAMRDDLASTEALLQAAQNIEEATERWLKALKPRHREGEVGKSRQSAEFRAIDRLDPSDKNYIPKITAYIQDLVKHYTDEPIGSKRHPGSFVRPALTGAARSLAGDLRQAIRSGNEDQKNAIVRQLKALDDLPGFKLPPGIRKLISRVDETGKETKNTVNKTKSAVNELADRTSGRLGEVKRAIAAKKMSVSVRTGGVHIKPAATIVGPTYVRATIGSRTLVRATRRSVAYGPGYTYEGSGTVSLYGDNPI